MQANVGTVVMGAMNAGNALTTSDAMGDSYSADWLAWHKLLPFLLVGSYLADEQDEDADLPNTSVSDELVSARSALVACRTFSRTATVTRSAILVSFAARYTFPTI